MTVLVVQSRLSSTRLPQKALLDLGGKPLLFWTLNAMKKVQADRYILATDNESLNIYSNIAQEVGFDCIAGSKDDVLKRFCLVIEQTNADTIIRVTGDNPFLIYESVASLEIAYKEHNCDYFAWSGLPHGSGAEIFSAKKLLCAELETTDSYDREHVAPSLYRYPLKYVSVIAPITSEWNFPDFRTTVDTLTDYEYAKRIVSFVRNARMQNAHSKEYIESEPFTAQEILASRSIKRKILCIPCTEKGKGTGHLRRCIQLAKNINADIYISNSNAKNYSSLLSDIPKNNLRTTLPAKNEYSLIVADMFELDRDFALNLRNLSSLIALDEGSLFTDYCDFLLDIIPSCEYKREPNDVKPHLIPLPQNRRIRSSRIKSVLISIGGEDPQELTQRCEAAFTSLGYLVTCVTADNPIKNLKEELHNYDLVVTHYGFTAFESYAAGCAVLLVATSPLHEKLSKHLGFTVLQPKKISKKQIAHALSNTDSLFPQTPILKKLHNNSESLEAFILSLKDAERYNCPICNKFESEQVDVIICRTKNKTYRCCSKCGMIYLSFSIAEKKEYEASYFFEEYKKQYGKTYLQDFESIKSQGTRRVSVLNNLHIKKNSRCVLLDIGCAYGPFLSAARDLGWTAYGTDISADAVQYVTNVLNFKASCGSFPQFSIADELGIAKFDAVTLWFVIEHFKNLEIILTSIYGLLNEGGLFAFSTPSGSGISRRFSKKSFFIQSPSDHYVIWEIKKTKKILARYGFKVKKIVSTGVHPERLPFCKNIKKSGMIYRFLEKKLSLLKWGDTFEVYCQKVQQYKSL